MLQTYSGNLIYKTCFPVRIHKTNTLKKIVSPQIWQLIRFSNNPLYF